jgi:hypothetical protein
MAEPTANSRPDDNPFRPEDLGESIRATRDEGVATPFVTFLFGAGCSKSAKIPLAGEIVQDLRADKKKPFLREVGPAPHDKSEYAFLMAKMGSPKARADYIKKCINRADHDSKGRLKINWSHLLLAAMVEKNYIHRILTTNFDPLIRIKPDYHDAYFNLARLSALRKNSTEAIAYLHQWSTLRPNASRTHLDKQADFDSIRDTPEFKAFREILAA